MTRFSIIFSVLGTFQKTLVWFPPLLARLSVGWVFVESGWGKLHHLDKVISFFNEMGIPESGLLAPLVAFIELIGGIAIILGLCTSLFSLLLIIVMIVAIITTKWMEIQSFSDLAGFPEYLFLVLLVWLGLMGAGAFSLNRILFRKFKK